MGRKRIDEEERKIPKTIGLPKWLWDKVEEQGKRSVIIEKILTQIFKK